MPQSHIDKLVKIGEARAAAKKVLKELRAKQKAEAKKHKRLMSKACRLSIQELKEIADMKQAAFAHASVSIPESGLTGSGSSSSTSAAPTPSSHASVDAP